MNPPRIAQDREPPNPVRARIAAASGFTLLEVVTVLVVIAILSLLVLSVVQSLQAKAARAHCVMNLRNLSVAANLYVQDRGHWPQVDSALLTEDNPAYCRAWIKALEPFGISQVNWICPTIQKESSNPDLSDPKNIRLDYTPMPFDENPRTPFRWPTHPWFIEKNSVHGNGNLIIFTNGSIREAMELIPKS